MCPCLPRAAWDSGVNATRRAHASCAPRHATAHRRPWHALILPHRGYRALVVLDQDVVRVLSKLLDVDTMRNAYNLLGMKSVRGEIGIAAGTVNMESCV